MEAVRATPSSAYASMRHEEQGRSPHADGWSERGGDETSASATMEQLLSQHRDSYANRAQLLTKRANNAFLSTKKADIGVSRLSHETRNQPAPSQWSGRAAYARCCPIVLGGRRRRVG